MNSDNLKLYKIWAPDGAEWTAWAKPVLFVGEPIRSGAMLRKPDVQATDLRAMIIVDLPGREGVEEALAYAEKGYRPVPLYNGTTGPGKLLVNVNEVREAILSGADELKRLYISPKAPPVFMLDSNRMNCTRTPGAYDNRWCVFEQDMPSAQYLKSKGINKIIVRTLQVIRSDLSRVLYAYQKEGIALYALRHNAKSPRELSVAKPSRAAELGYRFKVVIGLKRNAAGGFGGKIPDVYTSGGGRYYGYG